MSLTYRSPLEENLGAYDSTVQAAIASTSANYYRETEASNFQFFNYYLRPEAKKNLIDAGIYLSPFSAVPHSHAACKTLENHLLYNVLPSLIDNRFYFVGIKNCKLDLLKSRNTKLSTVAQINRYVTSADKARYGPDLVRVSSDPNVKIARHKFEVDGPTLRELIPRLQLVNHDYLFLHDELHYWSPKSLVTFLEIMKPAVMYATLVYPPELLAGSKVSLNRWCYTFKILGNDLLFYPDGVVCEGYQQPLRNGYLLKANRIELNNGDIYMVDVVHSKFAHHLISITRGELASPSVRSFGPFDATSTHGLEPLLRNVQHCFPVPYSVVSRIYRYLSTLKKPDVQSAMAKLSQLLEEPSGMEMKFLKDFASLVIGTNSICTLIKPERIKVFLGHWLKALPNPIAARLKIVQSVSLDDFIMMLAPFTFEVRLGTIRYNHHEIFNLYDMAECEEEIDLPALLDDRFTMGAPALIADRIPQLVSADFFNVYRKTSTLLKIPRSAFEKFVIRRVYNSLQPLTRSISTIDVMAELTSLLELRGLIILPSQQMIKILRKGDFLQCCIRKACSRFTRFLLPTWFEDPCFWFLQASRYNAQYLDQFPHGVAVYSAIKNPFATVVRDMSMFRPSTLRRRCPPPRYLRQVVVPPLCSLCDGRTPTDCAHCHEGVKDDCHQSDDPQVHPTESTPEAEDSRFGKSDEWGPSAQTASDAHTEEGVNGEAETKNTGEAHDEEPPPPPASNEEVDGASVIDEDEEQLPRTNPVREIGLFTCRCKLTIPVTTMPLPTNHNFSVKERLGNRSAGWYTRYGNVPYAYNGGAHADLGWPTWLDDWMFCNGIRTDYYDCVLYQIYDKHGRIGLHSDNEKIFEKGSSVHTCNLEGSAEFTIKCAEGSDRLLLKPGTQFTMPEGMQISHRHAVNDASSNRSSLTFRRLNLKYAAESAGGQESDERQAGAGSGNDDRQSNAGRTKPDVPSVDLARQSGNEEEGPSGSTADEEQPQREHHNNPGGFKIAGGLLRINDVSDVVRQMNYHCYEVPGDGNCFWYSMEKALGFKALDLKGKCGHYTFTDDPKAQQRLQLQMVEYAMAEDEAIMAAANVTRHTLQVLCPDEGLCYTYIPHTESKGSVYLRLQHQHFERIEPRNRCLIIAVAAALGREEASIMSVLEEKEVCTFHTSIWQGTGVAIEDLEFYFSLFDIQATVFSGERAVKYNGNGRIPASFNLVDGHITFCKKNNPVAVEIMRGEAVPLSVSEKSLLELTSFCTELTYHADPARAKVLADSLESGCTGIALSKLFNNARNMMSGVTETTAERIVHCLLGTFGSGKSTYFTKFTKQNPGKGVFYVSPRKALAIEHENKCLGRNNSKRKDGKVPARRGPDSINWHTLTFENFLKKIHLVKPGMALIVDEIQLYPPGYLDLVCFLLAPGVHTFVGGDPCQSDYDNEKDRAWLGSMVSDICRLLDGQVYKFNVQSQRFVNQNFSGRLPCIIDRSGKCGTGEAIDEPHLLYTGCDELVQLEEEFKEVFLVSSFEEKKIVETHFPEIPGGRVMTFGESTGLNFKNGTILITNVSSFTNEKRWVTALSRFRLNICLVNLVGVDWNSLAATYRNRVLGRFLSAQASKLDLCDLLPGKPEFTEGFTSYVGKDEGVREDKLVGDPWLKCMIDLGQTEDVEVAEIAEEVMQEEWFKTHLPQAELESVRARWVHKILAKERREVRMGSMVSDQFTDEYAKEGGAILTNAAERFETIYPRHRANDTVTFIMAVKKRLRFSRPAVERAKLIEADLYGEFLLKEFLKRVPLNGKHDPHMMQKAKQAFEEKKVSKSAAIIENHAGRSCRDWLLDIGQIFSKSQLCTKFDNRFRVAKAAQSIVCFQHAVLCRFAPYMRYIEMKVNEVLPKNYYIHSGKGLDELQEWVIKGKFSGVCTESDYEAFDASQDQYIVAFEVAVMKLLGLPRDLIEDYKFIKTHLGSKLGNFAIMRFSGEASTFLFNTMANMLFTFLRYDLKGREYICFAGDDMCASERLPLRKEHEGFLKKLKLKAKVFMVEKPTFCGWHLCPDGIYKKPQLVLERMLIAKEKNNLANCLDNYAIEVAYAYKLGERAVNRMDAEELEAAHNCVRIIIKNKKLLKSDILGFYSDLEAKMKC